jgi:acetoacetyl-CoA synthetase
MHRFMSGQGIDAYPQLHQWSVRQPAAFWSALADFCAVQFRQPAAAILEHADAMPGARWFVGATLNYAENLLRHPGDKTALIFRAETGDRREFSFDELRAAVAACAAGLEEAGVVKGDRVAGMLPNCPEAIIAMLATASLGAVWTSCSPDFGAGAVIDRFGQARPKLLFCANGYRYNGKRFDCSPTIDAVLDRVDSIESAIWFEFLDAGFGAAASEKLRHWSDFCRPGVPLAFVPVAFDDPLFILYSSGTTGPPKCIVHGVGGALLQHLKEHQLHSDIGQEDRLFYFTTCGWMMWNWLASGLASGATLLLYDGSPAADEGRVLWQIAEQERLTVFGTSPGYLSAMQKSGLRPRQDYDLSSLRCLLSTGAPLGPASFDYVYEDVAPDVHLASISGGTDLLGCFALGNPMLPVRRGELQCLGLGMAVEVFNDAGEPVQGEVGRLVCTRPFPSMPLGFWNDPDGSQYQSAYFEEFPGVWSHGDLAEITPSGGLRILGRADAVLNPGGVRIGTAEIYRQVEKLPEVLDSIAVGQRWGDDVRVLLFVVLREGVHLDETLLDSIRQTIRSNCSPRHVPARIFSIPDTPKTRSGKLVELAVRDTVNGDPVKNRDALANPEILDYIAGLEGLHDS